MIELTQRDEAVLFFDAEHHAHLLPFAQGERTALEQRARRRRAQHAHAYEESHVRLGEQFKRRLLMDGLMDNVSFVCTQTDELEVSDIWKDHHKEAATKPGRAERMRELHERMGRAAAAQVKLEHEEIDKAESVRALERAAKAAKKEAREAARWGATGS